MRYNRSCTRNPHSHGGFRMFYERRTSLSRRSRASKYWDRTHKYGIRVPKSYIEACQLDAENGNTAWRDAVAMEMKNVRPAFQVYEGAEKDLVGYQKIRCHMIYDIKLGENFRRKARLVAGGHTTNTPSSLTYSSVVSRDSVRICLLIAALNGLDVLSCDIQNAYLTAPCREKVYTVAGPEFGPEEAGKLMVIKQALYGLKSSGAAFHAKCAGVLWDLQFRPSQADNDVWMRPAVNGKFKYYEYVLCYVDDIVAISHRPDIIMDGIKATFKLKGDKVEVPSMYLGATLEKKATKGNKECWAMDSSKYIQEAIKNVENKLAEHQKGLPKAATPFSKQDYHPAHDTSPELDADDANYFQELIGVLRWGIEIGRIDILLEVSLLSTHLALPRRGHLLQVYNIFGYLKYASRRRLYFDPTIPKIPLSGFKQYDWQDFYKDAKEEMPHNMPEPRGNSVSMYCFVDASHAADKVNRKSHTGVLIFLNRAPILWHSKRQNTVETSTFGSELTAMKTAMEMIKGLRIKLRLLGIPIEGSCSVFTDNASVWKNVSDPTSTLNKKHHSISYHFT